MVKMVDIAIAAQKFENKYKNKINTSPIWLRSKCCNSKLIILDNSYYCKKCNKPCDVNPSKEF